MRALAKRPALLLLPLLALYIGIAVVTAAAPKPVNDEIDYVQLATNLTHGNYAYSGNPHADTGAWAREPNLWFGPGLPAVLAPLVALHAPLAVIRLTGPIFLFLAVLLFYRLLRLYAPPRWSLTGAALLGLYYPFYTLLNYVHSEPLAILLMVAAMYALARYFRSGRRRELVLGGAALGYLAMTRVAYGWVLLALLVVASVVALLRRQSSWARKTAAAAAIGLAVCMPWLAYTYSLSGRILYWGNSGGASLYWIASPYPGEAGDWQSPSRVFADPRFAPHRPFFSSAARLPSLERDQAFQHKALMFIRSHPDAYAANVAANVSRLFFGVPASFEPIRLDPLITYALPNLLLILAVLLAAVVRARRRLRLPPEAVALSLIALPGLGVHALLAGYSRMLTPTVPLLLWFVVTTVVKAREARVSEPAELPRGTAGAVARPPLTSDAAALS